MIRIVVGLGENQSVILLRRESLVLIAHEYYEQFNYKCISIKYKKGVFNLLEEHGQSLGIRSWYLTM